MACSFKPGRLGRGPCRYPEGETMITVRMAPGDRVVTFDRLNTVLQLLNRLGLGMTDALVAREGVLLTPDRKLRRGDELTVRVVASRG